ncbi:polysaccharide biosynthesis/export family protein [Thioclava indica]|uniref:Polysaccharide biosynthesis protein n=1 Tax=Thioclava indica TaxID=1353528 RepID=A0A074JKS7_9RHOB|nr:polysaccharide biosynthesis/export family protein [Thioclava indica]KEO58231.1 polysaccharide biosynthesis protein [Thioclava indica]
MSQALRYGSAFLAVLALANCAGSDVPDNLEPVATGDGYQAQYRTPDVTRKDAQFLRSAEINASKCRPLRGGTGGKGSGLAATALRGERLSRNDLVNIRVSDDDTFSGDYVVSRDGTLKLPFLSPIRAQGRRTSDIESDISAQLTAGDYFAEAPRISVRVADFASVTVGVSGAVFEPHSVEIGGVRGNEIDNRRQGALGASSEGRNLSAALRSAGGVRPDADISAIEVRRNGTRYVIDMRGVFEGQNASDIMLLTGDEITVPSRGCFQDNLMRPSPISPAGISLFMSNLTQPASGNATSAIGRDVREVPYGTRYLQAVTDLNCVGGARATSADRSAVLFSRNPVTKVSVVIERDIEDLLRRADRDDYDPYLLPGDSLACYDSTVTNLGEIIGVVGLAGLSL